MRVKSYFAPSVDAALQRARRELGEDALLLNSGPAPKEAQHLGAYEVVFGVTAREETAPPPSGAAATAPAASPSLPPPAEAASRQLLDDLASLRMELNRMRASVIRSGAVSITSSSLLREPELAALLFALLESDLPPELAQELVSAAARRTGREPSGHIDLSRLQRSLKHEIEARIQAAPDLDAAPRGRQRAIALVGPPGAGKTSALVKLAVSRGLPTRKPMHLLSLEGVRIGSSEQLRTYATILGVGFTSCDCAQTIAIHLEEHRQKDWLWIDTPGLASSDRDLYQEMAAFFTAHPQIEVYLVLSAAMRTADLMQAVERYTAFRPSRLLFTHLDETESHGALLSIPLAAGAPVAFLSAGQRIPEDLEAASSERLLALLMQRIWAQAPPSGWFTPQAGRAAAGL